MSAVSKILLEFGDPMGPEITFPPFARVSSAGVGVVFCAGEAPPLMAAFKLDGRFAEAFTSFLAMVCVLFALSKESPRLGRACSKDAAGICGCLGDSLAGLVGLEWLERRGVENPLSEGVARSAGFSIRLVAYCSTGSPASIRGVEDCEGVLGLARSGFLFLGASWSLNFSLDRRSLLPRGASTGRVESSDLRVRSDAM